MHKITLKMQNNGQKHKEMQNGYKEIQKDNKEMLNSMLDGYSLSITTPQFKTFSL